MANSWSPWQHAKLREMAANRSSSRAIATAIGKTKNSVIGMAWRHGIPLATRNNYLEPSHTNPPRSHKIPKIPLIHTIPATPQKPTLRSFPMLKPPNLPKTHQTSPALAPAKPVSPSGPVSLLERTSDQCCYVIGEPRLQIVCGQPVSRNSPYCENHYVACHAAA